MEIDIDDHFSYLYRETGEVETVSIALLGLAEDGQIMEDFSEHQREPLRSDIRSAIHGSGAFRMFKDTLRRRGRIETWYKFREQALRAIAVEWLKDHGVPYSEAPNPRESVRAARPQS